MAPEVFNYHYLFSSRPDVCSTTGNRALKLLLHQRSWNSSHRRMEGLHPTPPLALPKGLDFTLPSILHAVVHDHQALYTYLLTFFDLAHKTSNQQSQYVTKMVPDEEAFYIWQYSHKLQHPVGNTVLEINRANQPAGCSGISRKASPHTSAKT